MKSRGSLFHIAKRKELPGWKAWGIRAVSLILALIVCAVVTTLLTGLNPLSVFSTMIDGAFGTSRRIWILMQNVAILLCISLAVTPAFRMRFWNIGAEGQVLISGLAAASCMILFPNLPNWLLILIMCAASIAAGAVWAMIPAFFNSLAMAPVELPSSSVTITSLSGRIRPKTSFPTPQR